LKTQRVTPKGAGSQVDHHAGRQGDRALVGVHDGNLARALRYGCLQPRYVAVGHHHKALANVIPTRLEPGLPRRPDDQRYRAELVKREEPRAWQAALHRQRRLELLDPCGADGPRWLGQLSQRDRRCDLVAGDASKEQLAERLVHDAGNEVVGLVHTDLFGGLTEVPAPQVLSHIRRPAVGGHFGVKQLGRPTTQEDRATSNAVRETGEAVRHVRAPGQTPDFCAGYPWVDSCWPWRDDAQVRQILHVLGKEERTCFEHEDPVSAEAVGIEQVLGKRSAERTPTNYYDVEEPSVRSSRSAVKGLVEAIADVAAQDILTEVRVLSCGAGRHGWHSFLPRDV